MKPLFRRAIVFAAVVAAGGAGYWQGHSDDASRASVGANVNHVLPAFAKEKSASRQANDGGPIIYYQDPDGRPIYSSEPKTTRGGRAFRAVHIGQDISFSGEAADHESHVASQQDEAGKKRILYYRNPMGLPDTSPVPKKDPMGMDYIPVYAGDDVHEKGIIKISAGKLQTTGVRSEPVSERTIVRHVRVPGTIQVDERLVSVVATRSESFINKVENVTTGDRVRKGEPLLELYSPDINAAAAQLVASPGYDGSRRRLQNLDVQDAVIAAIEKTRKVPLSIPWYSPRDGIVLERNAVDGMKADAGDVLFRIADASRLWAIADVPEYDMRTVRVGEEAKIHIRGISGRVFSGRVGLIYPQVDMQTRTTKVRIEIANPDGALRPNMYADVDIDSSNARKVIAVPEDAVIDTGTKTIVLLDMGGGRFRAQPVILGAQGGGYSEIEKGLSLADRVVVSANFLIDSESNLKAALSAMDSQDGNP